MLKKITGNMPIPFLRQGEDCRIALRIIRIGKSAYCVVIVVDNRYIVPIYFLAVLRLNSRCAAFIWRRKRGWSWSLA